MILAATLFYNQPPPLAGEVHMRVPLLLFGLQVSLLRLVFAMMGILLALCI